MAAKKRQTAEKRVEQQKVLSNFAAALADAYTSPKPGPLDKGLPFEVSEDGTVAVIATEDEVMAEAIHFANTRELRGGMMALRMREIMVANGVWNRFVTASFAAGSKPLGKTTPEQQQEILSVFSKERSTRCGQ